MSTNYLFTKSRFGLLLSLTGAIWINSASADQNRLEEVVVSAQKTPQNLQQVPVAVTVIDEDSLQSPTIDDLYAAQLLAPSLSLSRGSSSSSANFGIRGISTSPINLSLEPSVGLYVDDIYRAQPGAMVNDLLDLARIEVLRGPQGTLFGRNTSAGAVALWSKAPDHDNAGYLALDAGNLDYYRLQGASSFSLQDDVLALRLSGTRSQRDGFVDNLSGDKPLNNRDRWALRAQALYTPNDDISLRVIADTSTLDEDCCALGSWQSNLLATALPPGSAPKFGSDAAVLALGGTVIPDSAFSSAQTAVDRKPSSHNRDRGLSAQLDWQRGPYLFTSITGYREFDFDDSGDGDFTDLSVFTGAIDLDQQQLSQEFRLRYQTDTYSVQTGLYWLRNRIKSRSTLTVGHDLSLLAQLPPTAFPADTSASNRARQDNRSVAVFAQLDTQITDTLSASAGVRWTRERKSLSNHFYDDASPLPDFTSPGWGFWLIPALRPRPDIDTNLKDEQPTGSLRLSWQLHAHHLAYISYASGYKAGGLNTDRVAIWIDPLYDAETSEALEIGFKSEFPEAALRLNVAAHLTTVDDLQTYTYTSPGTALQNAGKARFKGLEFDMQWRPIDALELNLNYAYNRGELRQFENANCWVATPWHSGLPDPNSNGDGSCDRSGADVLNNPRHRALGSASWYFQLGKAFDARLYGEVAYTGEHMTNLNNDPLSRDGDYSQLALVAELTYRPWRVTLSAWGRNLNNPTYTALTSDAPLQEGRLIATLPEPKTWGISLRHSW